MYNLHVISCGIFLRINHLMILSRMVLDILLEPHYAIIPWAEIHYMAVIVASHTDDLS